MSTIIVKSETGTRAVISGPKRAQIIVSGQLRGIPGTPGAPGATGATGATGIGLVAGGTYRQVLSKKSATDQDTRWADVSAAFKTITQINHGFVPGNIIRFDGTKYVLSQADTVYNAEVVGIVADYIDASTFIVTTEGHVKNLSGLAVGALYFLSANTAGAMDINEPTTVGQVSKPLFTADTANSGFFHNYRGIEL